MATSPRSGSRLRLRDDVMQRYSDIFTPEAVGAIEALAAFNAERLELIDERTKLDRSATQRAERLPAEHEDNARTGRGTLATFKAQER